MGVPLHSSGVGAVPHCAVRQRSQRSVVGSDNRYVFAGRWSVLSPFFGDRVIESRIKRPPTCGA